MLLILNFIWLLRTLILCRFFLCDNLDCLNYLNIIYDRFLMILDWEFLESFLLTLCIFYFVIFDDQINV